MPYGSETLEKSAELLQSFLIGKHAAWGDLCEKLR
jgi:hypothetical protein